MDDRKFRPIKERIDELLSRAPQNAGLALGSELYAEFKARQLLAMETFIWLGVSHAQLFSDHVPAYRGSHFVHEDFGLGPLEFKVGGAQSDAGVSSTT